MVKTAKSGSNKNSVSSVANKTKARGSSKPGTKDPPKSKKDTRTDSSFEKPAVNELRDLYENGKPFDKNWSEHREETEYVLKPDINELIRFWENINEKEATK
ncbi:hypothetical protein VCUG_02243 [Vavraia culicis subsp. floridensis]|uniref:Uncharacterized protein n=1 Tax=Vavraia culicis (isolate floridensis) TaxID=948595 RepID=L2GRJ3_VAVCU|nr:uncharacterized protein VCUG_02243 [Vavraia culicis subsp. floridensis]ELA46276.1 hypothetical protein VCUG_02243 [Vavraia culicis subsp. floridensis]